MSEGNGDGASGDDRPPGPPQSAVSGTIIVADDAPLVPATVSDAELRAAVGIEPDAKPGEPAPASKRDKQQRRAAAAADRDDPDAPAPRPRGMATIVLAVLAVGGGVIGAMILLGRMNATRYEIACDSHEVRAKVGRAFPPWGERELPGDEWRPIELPPDAECKPRETEDADELAGWYLDILLDRASAALLARDPAQAEPAAALLSQALLLARAPEKRDQRRTIERLLGDVEYWRATAKLGALRSQLADAAKQFDVAAGKLPRYVSDAGAWAAHLRSLSEQLQALPGTGSAATVPTTLTPAPLASEARVPAPPGVALPIEPLPSTASGSAPASAPPDAGVMAGGVLL